jgi:carbonic anhydrase
MGLTHVSASSLAALEPNQEDATPDAVLARLMEGNKRFTSGRTKLSPRTPADFARDVQGQAPPAIVLSCADSRVPPEFVFDQPIGGLFVLRVAGNIVGAGPILKGSVEFAVAELGAKLIIVMGHSLCGAVDAAITHIDKNDQLPGSIGDMVDYIRPVVRKVADQPQKPADKLVAVTKANALHNAQMLAKLDPIVSDFVQRGAVKVVGAYYEMSTGAVEILG